VSKFLFIKYFQLQSVLRYHNKNCVKTNIFVNFSQHTTKPGFTTDTSVTAADRQYQCGVQQCAVMLVRSKFYSSQIQEKREFVLKKMLKKLQGKASS